MALEKHPHESRTQANTMNSGGFSSNTRCYDMKYKYWKDEGGGTVPVPLPPLR